jgi:type II secretion system protein C
MKTYMTKPKIKKKTATRITPGIEARIVDLSLKNPEFGAKRLLRLLNPEDIGVSVSMVYNILKRNGLQNRDKRFAAIEAQQAVAAPSFQASEIPHPAAVPAPITVGLPSPVSQPVEEKVLPPRGLPIPSITQRAVTGRPWFITLINSVLVFLIVILGFHTWHNVSQARLEPDTIALAPPKLAITAVKPGPPISDSSDVRMIAERNLFNAAKSEAPGPPKAIPVDKLAPAQKELDLQLVGTFVAYDSRLSRAFIGNRQTRRQKIYSEGDKVNDVTIKKILRNKVIIATKEGDRLLTVRIAASGKSNETYSSAPQLSRASVPQSQSHGRPSNSARVRHISLDRQEVEDSLANVDQLLQELTLTPYMRFQKPAGFRISNLSRDSIFNKMGLSSRDVIVGINDQKITSPDQAAEFLQTLKGDVRAERA